jgi:hypothetical protein
MRLQRHMAPGGGSCSTHMTPGRAALTCARLHNWTACAPCGGSWPLNPGLPTHLRCARTGADSLPACSSISAKFERRRIHMEASRRSERQSTGEPVANDGYRDFRHVADGTLCSEFCSFVSKIKWKRKKKKDQKKTMRMARGVNLRCFLFNLFPKKI